MLGLSIVALFLGPLLYIWLQHRQFSLRRFDQLLTILLALMLGGFLVPDIWQRGAWLGIALIFLGYLLPGVLERLMRPFAALTHKTAVLIGVLGLSLHAITDGAALAGSLLPEHTNYHLPVAVVIHRLGVGLAIWLMLANVIHKAGRFAFLGLISVMTLIGYYSSLELIDFHQPLAGLVFEALISGLILHGLVHRAHLH